MSSTLVFIAGNNPEEQINWALFNDRRDLIEQGFADISQLGDLTADSVWLVLSGTSCTTRLVQLAARNRNQLRQAAPFAVEDEIASPIDDVHVATGAEGDAGLRPVTVISKREMSAWVEAFKTAGIKLDGVVADYHLVPSSSNAVSIWRLPDRTLLRSGDWGACLGASTDESFLGAIVQSAIQYTQSEHRVDEHIGAGAVAELFASGIESIPVNLLQGDYAVKIRQSFSIQGWKTLAGLAAALFLIVVGSLVLETSLLKSRTKAVNNDTSRIVMTAFPDIRRVVNPRSQVEQRTKSAGQGRDEFLKLSSLLIIGLQASEKVEVETLRFDSNQNQLKASVAFDDYVDLASLKKAIEDAGGTLAEGGSREFNGRRLGDVTVTR